MNICSAFIVLALTSSPMPSPNFNSWIAPEISNTIINCVIKGEYQQHLDFNDDNFLTIADAVGVAKRYDDNVKYGNKITFDSETVNAIIEENYSVECIYQEIDFINNEPCREYELTVNEVTTANIYLEFENDTIDNIKVEINPFEEVVSVLS